MLRTFSIAIGLAALSAGCAGAPRFMRQSTPEDLIASPPAGKALVNFHRPTTWGGGVEYIVYDRDRLIGNTLGGTRFQHVCDPGEHVFHATAQKVMVIRADLEANQTYDVVIDVAMGWWVPNIVLEPITKTHERRPEVGQWEGRESLVVSLNDATTTAFEARMKPNNDRILQDFLGGEKDDRVLFLAADDHR